MTYAASLAARNRDATRMTQEVIVVTLERRMAHYLPSIECVRWYGERDIIGSRGIFATLADAVAAGIAFAREWQQTWPLGTRIALDLSGIDVTDIEEADFSAVVLADASIVHGIDAAVTATHDTRYAPIVIMDDDTPVLFSLAMLACGQDERDAMAAHPGMFLVHEDIRASRDSAVNVCARAARLSANNPLDDNLYMMSHGVRVIVGYLYGSDAVRQADMEARLFR